jgi:hypothetical protein
MTLWKRIRQLGPGALWRLCLLLLSRPPLVLPTIRATRRTFKVTGQLYGKSQAGSGRANAFRHACWNALLACYSHASGLSPAASAEWAKKVTDLHENLVVNPKIDRLMDLHNNAVGRTLFLANSTQNEAFFIKMLQKMTKNAQKLIKNIKLDPDENDLVYIEEPTK